MPYAWPFGANLHDRPWRGQPYDLAVWARMPLHSWGGSIRVLARRGVGTSLSMKTTLDDLRRAAEALPPGASITLPREALLEVLSHDAAEAPDSDTPPDRLLKASEVAERLAVSRKFIYEHLDRWPFVRRIGSTVRFSEKGLERWLARQR
jgi:excisionase family DNA binding protein